MLFNQLSKRRILENKITTFLSITEIKSPLFSLTHLKSKKIGTNRVAPYCPRPTQPAATSAAITSMPHYRNVGSRLGATVPLTPPCSLCSLCPHRRTATLHAPPMPHCPPCHNVGSRHGATEPPSQPRSGNCRLTAHRDATLPTLPHCRVAPWCDRATNPTAPPSVILV